MLVIAPLIAGVIAIFGRRIRKAAKRRQESPGDVTQRLVQILTGIKVIKAFRAERGEAEDFARENLRYFRRNMRVQRNRALSRTFVEALNNLVGVGRAVRRRAARPRPAWGLSLGALVAFVIVMQSPTAR